MKNKKPYQGIIKLDGIQYHYFVTYNGNKISNAFVIYYFKLNKNIDVQSISNLNIKNILIKTTNDGCIFYHLYRDINLKINIGINNMLEITIPRNFEYTHLNVFTNNDLLLKKNDDIIKNIDYFERKLKIAKLLNEE